MDKGLKRLVKKIQRSVASLQGQLKARTVKRRLLKRKRQRLLWALKSAWHHLEGRSEVKPVLPDSSSPEEQAKLDRSEFS